MKIKLNNYTSPCVIRDEASDILGILNPGEELEVESTVKKVTANPLDSIMQERADKGITVQAGDPPSLARENLVFLPSSL